jgi:asparagine synthase (glutamine-hydrolysing)
MSGFAGVVSGDGAPVDRALLERMAERLAFRGPDGTGIRSLGAASFCFAFARTGPAPQSPDLPITVDGRHWLLGDVRLDGREELSRRLSSPEAPVTASRTDEELALCASLADRTDDLFGDYAFAIWEPAERRLVCLRDIIGAKPLFYGQAGSSLCFSNTLDVLRLVPGLDLRPDEHFVGDFLLQGWCGDLERTIYRGIRRLKPGHRLEFRDGELRSRRFTSLPIEEPLSYRRGADYVEHFRSLLTASVCERLPQSNVAVFLSGGLDSTSVAAVAAQASGKQRVRAGLRAYTIDFRPLFDDQEPPFAAKAAQHFNMPIEMIKAGDELPFVCWSDSAVRFPEPLHEPFQSRYVQMCRHMYAFARVVLSGDGGDDLLGGSGGPYARYLVRQGRPFELLRVFAKFLWQKRRLPELGTGLRGRLRSWRTGPPREPRLPEWLRAEFANRMGLRDRLAELCRGYRQEHPYHPAGHAALTGGYWAGVLEDEDAAWLGVPLERRSPFLDRRLLRFLLRVPPVPWCIQKELLREAMRGLLPEPLRTRGKTPLPHSPFALQAEKVDWNPLPLPAPEALLAEFLDWRKLEATLRSTAGFRSWDDLRPLSLNSWAKAVENG